VAGWCPQLSEELGHSKVANFDIQGSRVKKLGACKRAATHMCILRAGGPQHDKIPKCAHVYSELISQLLAVHQKGSTVI
jgi:hypothetical protein